MNAITAAGVLLSHALTCLERHALPSLNDVEDALDYGKSAVKRLQAAIVLLEDGIYSVADEPDQGQPLPLDSAEVVQKGGRR